MIETDFDVIVVGGGAAGLMCAMEAGARGASVFVLEHNSKVGEKIRISGGGRCNFTNLFVSAENYLSHNPHFCKSALARYSPYDFLAMVEEYGISYHERRWGQLFCDHSAQQIIDMFIERCKAAQVSIQTGCRVKRVSRTDHFVVDSSMGQWTSKMLVIATGGLSIPKMGATDFGYRVATQFGLPLVERRPALAPLKVQPSDLRFFQSLRGIAFDAEVDCLQQQAFRENILFTHRGLSGPAILQISSYWAPGQPISIDLLPGLSFLEHCKEQGYLQQRTSNALSHFLPRRFTQQWCERYGYNKPLQHYSEKELEQLEIQLHHWEFTPLETEGYRKAEVTVGGVDTDALSSKTMAAKDVPGLFFIGEVVDVTGWLGGYNFQWAWASGYAAAIAIAESL